jgi:DNA-binding NtrC family response regulator
MPSPIRLVFCSADLKLRPVLAPALGKEFTVIIERRRQIVKELVSQGECDVVILDLDPACCTVEEQVGLCEEIADASIAILAMAGDDGRSTAMELVDHGAFGYVRKPPALPELKVMVRRAHESTVLKRGHQISRLPQLQAPVCGDMIGVSAPMRAVYDLMRRVADHDASVLITGESGTGKELVAHGIHSLGSRANRPFVVVPCGAIPENLIEAELFGHEKGAFTNANGMREGYFEKAGEGTLLLDEIGELSLNMQPKLLRALQQREFSRLGSTGLIPLRARILFATHRNLERMVAANEFRQDLFYRINVMDVHLPPLRDHAEDIPLLAQHFMRRYSKMYRRPAEAIESAAMKSLANYDWPGNVRELENVIQRAVILAEGTCIRLADLPEAFQESNAGIEFLEDEFSASFEGMIREYRIKLVNEAIQECNGNKTLAAQRLSISRAYLHRLIRVPYGVQELPPRMPAVESTRSRRQSSPIAQTAS